MKAINVKIIDIIYKNNRKKSDECTKLDVVWEGEYEVCVECFAGKHTEIIYLLDSIANEKEGENRWFLENVYLDNILEYNERINLTKFGIFLRKFKLLIIKKRKTFMDKFENIIFRVKYRFIEKFNPKGDIDDSMPF